jgi:hypothetical protein
LVPYFTKELKKARKPINARSETIARSGMFKAAFAERRCLVPAPRVLPSGATIRTRNTPFAWRASAASRSRSGHLGTVEIAGARDPPDLRNHHHGCQPPARRYSGPPVIIEPKDWPLWLGEAEGDPGSLLRPAPEDVMRVWPVGLGVDMAVAAVAALEAEVDQRHVAAAGVEFIDENGGGPGVRLRKRQQKKG